MFAPVWACTGCFLFLLVLVGLASADSAVLQHQRLLAAESFVQLGGAIGQYSNITAQRDGLYEILSPSAVFISEDYVWTPVVGVEDIFKTLVLFNADVNGGVLERGDAVILNATYQGDEVQTYVQETWSAPDGGDSLNFTISMRYVFENASDTVLLIEEDGLADAFDFVFRSSLNGADVVAICSMANAACPGTLFPFGSVLECLNFMDSIPNRCDIDGKPTFLGNTSMCRLRWAAAAQIDPLSACPMISSDSMACLQDSCGTGRLLGEYSPVSPVPDVNTALFQSVPILVVAFLVAFLPALSYLLLILFGFSVMRECSAIVHEKQNALQSIPKHSLRCLSGRSGCLGIAARDLVVEGRQRTLLRHMSFYFSSGELVAIMGASGAGKSTLLKLMSGKPVKNAQQFGDLLLVRRGGTATPLATCGESLGYVEQHVESLAKAHPELTVEESLMAHALLVEGLSQPLPGDEAFSRETAIQKALVKVREVVDAMGLHRVLHRKMAFLSGGEQKRWRLARELLEDPSILMVDEGTSGLDSEAALSLTQALHALTRKGVTTVMTVHQPRNTILDLVDSILMLGFGGRVVVLGKYQLIKSQLQSLSSDGLSMMDACVHGRDGGWLGRDACELLVSAFWRLDESLDGIVRPSGDRDTVVEPGKSQEMHDAGETRAARGLSLHDVVSCIRGALGVRASGINTPSAPVSLEHLLKVLRSLSASASGDATGPSVQALVLGRLVEEMEWMLQEDEVTLPPLLAGDSMGDALVALCEHRSPVTAIFPSSEQVRREVDSLTIEQGTETGVIFGVAKDSIGRKNLEEIKRIVSRMRKNCRTWAGIQQIFTWQTIHGLGVKALVPAAIAQLIGTAVICLLYFRLGKSSVSDLWQHGSSLLIVSLMFGDLSSLTINKVFMSSESYFRISKRGSSVGSYLPALALNHWLLYLMANLIPAVAYTTIYYFVVDWNVQLTAYGFLASLTSMKLLVDCHSTVSFIGRLAFGPQNGRFPGTFWGIWNALFSGRIIPFQAAFVIWRYWSFYVTPMYNLINIWAWSNFYKESVECPPRDPPEECPMTQTMVLKFFGYSSISSGISLLILIGTWLLYATVLVVIAVVPRLNTF
ncbi:hypothetical protein M9435_004771 [Picochlorum sp. BPE23]|nr:hypothetical protein M9435_004771 [Picochlorum sp. BPE23]